MYMHKRLFVDQSHDDELLNVQPLNGWNSELLERIPNGVLKHDVESVRVQIAEVVN